MTTAKQAVEPRRGFWLRAAVWVGRLVAAIARRAFHGPPARLAVSSFAVAVVVGAVLLTLPISSHDRVWTNFVDSLFTSTSAVCVTGLIVKSTPHYWSLFGQIVILVLIQIGGLGIMTMGAFVASMLRTGISLRFENMMTDLVETDQTVGVLSLVRFICIFTLLVEALGTAALYLAWRGRIGPGAPCFYQSVFHSISAFCNAGFSIMPNDTSLTGYAGTISVNFIICALIVVGGIGFLVVRDVQHWLAWRIFTRRGRRPRLSTHSRLALLMTGVLLVLGFLAFLCIETGHSLKDKGATETMLAAIFQSVTPRTAGFNTVDMKALAPATVFLLMVLMYIGGSPGGTAGGVKTTTVGIMVASISATLRGRDKAELFHHSIAEETVHRVAGIILLSFAAIAGGGFILLITENRPDAAFGKIMFETVSAFGTVGLSRGLTGPNCDVTAVGKLVLTALMFIGRLGPIALILSVASLREPAVYRYPEDRVFVG